MRRSGILNADLAHAIASMGHGDTLMVVDAGFPVPAHAWRIDLAVARDVPDLRTVLRLIADELIVERIQYAEDVPTHNAPLAEWLAATWPGVETATAPHSQMLTEVPRNARAIVRTGAFDPWGNIALTSGVDVAAFFSQPGVVVPDYYANRLAAAEQDRA
jgi:simple sugar transport system permease protein/D-ribose pyranase